MSSTLLQTRSRIKGKKPTFTRQESHRKARVGHEWRKPRGMHSKMRLHVRGKKRSPTPGWGSPREVEGLHPSGLRSVLAATLQQIDSIKEGEGAVIAATVGMRKRVALVEHARKKNITVLNVRDAGAFLKSVSEQMAQRKAARKRPKAAPKKEGKHEEKKEDARKAEHKEEHKEEQKEKKEQKGDNGQKPPAQGAGKLTEEEQKKKDKEEQDKLLTKRL